MLDENAPLHHPEGPETNPEQRHLLPQSRGEIFNGTIGQIGRQAVIDLTAEHRQVPDYDIRTVGEGGETLSRTDEALARSTPHFIYEEAQRLKATNPAKAEEYERRALALSAFHEVQDNKQERMEEQAKADNRELAARIAEQNELYRELDNNVINANTFMPNRPAFDMANEELFRLKSKGTYALEQAEIRANEMGAEFSDIHPEDEMVIFMYFDVDYLKDVNDAAPNGHADGNMYLRQVGKILKRHFTPESVQQFDPHAQILPGQIGGDELAIVLNMRAGAFHEAFGVDVVADEKHPDSAYFELKNPSKIFEKDFTRSLPDHDKLLESPESINNFIAELLRHPSVSIGTAAIRVADLQLERQLAGREKAKIMFDGLQTIADLRMTEDKERESRRRLARGKLSDTKKAMMGEAPKADAAEVLQFNRREALAQLRARRDEQ